MTALAARGERRKSSGGLRIGRPSFLWSMPAFVYFVVCAIVPLGVVVWLSFTTWDALGSPAWVGSENYEMRVAADGSWIDEDPGVTASGARASTGQSDRICARRSRSFSGAASCATK